MMSPTVGQVELMNILKISLQEISHFMKIHPVKKTVGLIMKQKIWQTQALVADHFFCQRCKM